MKIISGKFRNRQLIAPKEDCRPTSSRLREAVFNILMHSIENSSFLDICAGTGAMGLEAISRGADSAYFLEQNNNCIKAIKDNILSLEVKDKAFVIPGNLFTSLKRLSERKLSFNVCYIDPPYSKTGKDPLSFEILKALDKSDLLSPNASIFLEESSKVDSFTESFENITLLEQRVYGDTTLYIFSKTI